MMLEIRRVPRLTNAIESLNARYRRAVRARGHFPNEQSALKTLYLVTRSLDPKGHRVTSGPYAEASSTPWRSRSPIACQPPKNADRKKIPRNATYTEYRTVPAGAANG